MSLWVRKTERTGRRSFYFLDVPWELAFLLIGIVIAVWSCCCVASSNRRRPTNPWTRAPVACFVIWLGPAKGALICAAAST